MRIGRIASWLGMVFGPRRVLMVSGSVFMISNCLLPFSPDLKTLLAFQVMSGLSSGTLIPLTIGFVTQNLPAHMVVYGVAAYFLNLELSLNVSASIEGWFTDKLSWEWIFWDTPPLTTLIPISATFLIP